MSARISKVRMITATNDVVVVSADGLLTVCSWCVSPKRMAELDKAYRCTDGLCDACRAKFIKGDTLMFLPTSGM